MSQGTFMIIFRSAVKVLCVLALALGSSKNYGQTWPKHAVKVIVPFGSGGSSDAQARIVSERLTAVLGQPVIVEDRPGASGAIAAELVARAPADGYTLFLSALPQISIVPLVQKVHYDPLKDFAPVSIVSTNPFVLGVPVELPVRTVLEFVEYARARPQGLYYASLGTATGTHLASVQFLARTGLRMTHVPYKESSQVFAGVTGGAVQMLFNTPSDMIRLEKAGKVRLLATSGEKRAPRFPGVPAAIGRRICLTLQISRDPCCRCHTKAQVPSFSCSLAVPAKSRFLLLADHCNLISTSTPAGRSSFISWSTVLSVGSMMSISRRCVRISN